MNTEKNGQPVEIERKYLIPYPSDETLDSLPEADCTEIVQTYLAPEGDGFGKRIRKRGTKERGYTYTYTQKKRIGFGERIELEDEITEEVYLELLKKADPQKFPIEKKRYCFRYDGQVFELDVYDCIKDFATLEIELPDINTPISLPPFLTILADVTDNPLYTNSSLSAGGGTPAANRR